MLIKDLLDKRVLDKNAYELGKISSIDIDKQSGKINTLEISLSGNSINLFSKETHEISFEDIETIGTFVLLNTEISKENAE